MPWTIEFADSRVETALADLQPGFVARFIRYAERMEIFGPDLGMPHTRAMGDGLYELRLKGPDGLARVFYCTLGGRRIVMLHVFVKKSAKTPLQGGDGSRTSEEGTSMKSNLARFRRRAFRRAGVRNAYDGLDEEFAFLDEVLRARARAGLTQAEVAKRVGTTQSAIARLESGAGKHSPSVATLQRYARALGFRLEIRLVRVRDGVRRAESSRA
jgi:phage-related protein/DNA-binding XRE family transcriptional regulator